MHGEKGREMHRYSVENTTTAYGGAGMREFEKGAYSHGRFPQK